MQNKDRRIRCRLVEFIERWHPPFGKLEFIPSAYHPHPLRRRCTVRLRLEHTQRISQRRNALPAQLKIVIEAATDQMEVGVVQPWNYRAPLQINHLRSEE